MKFLRELYNTEIVPSVKNLIIAIVRGIKSFFQKVLHVIENPWTSLAGLESQKKTVIEAYQSADWFTFAHGLMLVLGALVVYDNPFKNWGVVKGKLSDYKDILSPPTPPIPTPPEEDNVAKDERTRIVEVGEENTSTDKVAQASAEMPMRDFNNLPYANKITINKDEFLLKLNSISARLKIKPAWLMITIWIESTFNRGIVNKYSGTVGLIQWTIGNVCEFWGLRQPVLHKNKNGSLIITSEIRAIHQIVKNTSGVEQLDKIYEYLEPYIGRMHSVYDVYFAVFYPHAIGKHRDFELGSERSVSWMRKVYEGNKNLDLFGDRDGKLEVLDVQAWVDAHVPQKFIGKL